MALFEGFGRKLGQAAQRVGKRTSEVAELGRLNAKLQGVKQDMDALYIQIGKAFHTVRESWQDNEAVALLCQKVDHLKAEEAALARKIDHLKQQKRCEKCGDVQPASALFCSACGARLPGEPEPEPTPEPEPEDTAPATADEAAPEIEANASDGSVEVEINWPGGEEPTPRE